MSNATAITKSNNDQIEFLTNVESKYYNNETIHSDYIIFATGGFSASVSKLKT